jgi:signal transduction histidine kinase
MSFTRYCRKQSKYSLLAMALLGVLFVGYLDYITGYEVSLFLFYAGPILYAVWFTDRNCTILVVLLSAVVWWWADAMAGHPYATTWVHVWETGVRLVFFGFVGIGGSALKSRQLSIEAWATNIEQVRELERAIVAAGEREQERLGADINDGLCQYLGGLVWFTGSLRDHLSERCRPEARLAGELHELLRDAIVQARNIAHEMPALRQEKETRAGR